MSVLILLLGGLSVAAMMATRFDAMTVQLAVLRALGYERREIRSWLLEGAFLGVGACLVGGLADAALFPLIRGMLGTALPPPSIVHSPIYQSFPVWITAIGATTAAVFIPLFRLYQQRTSSSRAFSLTPSKRKTGDAWASPVLFSYNSN